MNEHKVTENILNAGFQRSATISCSCGLEINFADLHKTSLSVARKRFKEMHENKQKPTRKITTNPVLTPDELRDLNKKPKKEKVEADFKKPRSVEKLAKQQKKIQKIYEEDDDEPELELNEN